MSTASAALVGIAAVRGCILRDDGNHEPAGCEALQYHAQWHEAVPTCVGSIEISDRHKERINLPEESPGDFSLPSCFP